jgi:LmbE family N-acetylglucosaminyl deacetylase
MERQRRALVVGAHPDDCALGAAGTSILLKQAGWSVTFLTMTDGELGGDPQVRIAEERASARVLGVELDLCHMRDGAIDGPGAVRVLEEKLARYQPELIFTHEPTDSHSDHRVLSDSLLSAARRHSSLLFYEGPSTQSFAATLRLDISAAWDLKVNSLLAHASQRERVRTVEWAESVGRHRAWPHYRGVCEAFVPARLNLDMLFPPAVELAAPLNAEVAVAGRAKFDRSVS